MSARRSLQLTDEDAAIAEIERLRSGYTKVGKWSLEQAAYHLDQSLQSRMQPGPHPANMPEQDARRDTLQQVLASGRLPDGILAPPSMEPSPECTSECVDSLIATLRKSKTFPGPFAPHRLFGSLSDADMRRINMIHIAHHLSYLVPTNSAMH